MKEITLVEVLMVTYEKGDKEYSHYLNSEIEYSVPNWQDVTEEVVKEVKNFTILMDEDLVFTEDCTCFVFRFIGQGFDRHYSGGMEWESREAGYDYIFEGWIDELKKIATKVREGKVKQGLQVAKESNCVRFVTAWEWTSYRYSYNGEWDSEWELLGLVDLSKIEDCLVKDV